ncbi:MAG: nuclear transport factor 2 family protein [Terriglobales bacterium]
MRLLICLLVLLLSAFRLTQAQDTSASESKILAFENAWSQAEEHQDAKALDSLLDNSLVYIRYDGSLWSKTQYLASLKDSSSHIEQGVNESMVAHLYGNNAIVTGIYRVKGVEKGKSYLRRERFIDNWVHQNGTWVCVASQVTLISH